MTIMNVSPGWWINAEDPDVIEIHGLGLETPMDLGMCFIQPFVEPIDMEKEAQQLAQHWPANGVGVCPEKLSIQVVIA